MAAVWGRLRAVSSTEVLQHPLTKKQRRDDAARGAGQGASDKAYWQDSFDSRLNALGISKTQGKGTHPYRYEILKGKAVPRYGDAEEAPRLESSPPLTSIEDDVKTSLVFAPPPPRNPLRRLQSEPDWRPTSSVYDVDISAATPSAVPSPLQVGSAKMDPRAVALQISPPSSPDIDGPVRKPSPEDVSPIDDEFDMAQQELIRGPRPTTQDRSFAETKVQDSPPRSNIPTMRRDRRKQQEAALASRREPRPRESQAPPVQPAGPPRERSGAIPRSDGMRWDRDGSPVFGGSSRIAVPPGNLPFGSTTTISGGPVPSPRNQQSPSFGERVRQFGIGRAKPAPLDSRPAWNGASGRSNPIQPVRDNVNVAPLQAPPKNAKRAGRGGRGGGFPPNGSTTPGSHETMGPATSDHRMMPYYNSTQQSDNRGHSAANDPNQTLQRPASPKDDGAQSYPSPPYSGSPMRMSPETALPSQPPTNTSTHDISAAQLPAPPMVIPPADKAIKRKPPPAHSNQHHAARDSLSANARRQSVQAVQDDDGWVQLPSRFSISTRATSHNGSPRPSDDVHRPPLPETTAQPSVMDRSRPRYEEDSNTATGEPIVISVKPFSGFGRKEKASRHSAMAAPQRRRTGSIEASDGRPLSVMSTSKALPPAPPELSSHDRVGNLNARLADLAHRRNNINRSIKQMTELMPVDRLMAGAEVLRKREIEKTKVEGLREELAEVQQEEYELGLKLHRAYKRLDREAEFEPTGLWVKRVTSY